MWSFYVLIENAQNNLMILISFMQKELYFSEEYETESLVIGSNLRSLKLFLNIFANKKFVK